MKQAMIERVLGLVSVIAVVPSLLFGGLIYVPTSGITFSEAGGITFSEAGGITFSEAGGITFSEAGGLTFSEAGGLLFGNPAGITFSEAGGITFSEAGGITFSEAGGITFSEAGGIINHLPSGITFSEAGGVSVDLTLLSQLSVLDTSSLNVIVTYENKPTTEDLKRLTEIGIIGGTIFRELPMVVVNATKPQVRRIVSFPGVSSIWANQNTALFVDRAARQVHADSTLPETMGPNGPRTGRGVGVAIVDTGIDSAHPDLAGRVAKNVRVVSPQGTALGFVQPVFIEARNTDLVYGHGTFVAGVVAGSGSMSGGRVQGLAPDTKIVGVGVGELLLTNVLEGLDAVLSMEKDHNVRVVNCSFGVQGLFDPRDPVNVATRMLYDRGIVVVMAAGNHGPRPGTISPYAVAPWVIGVAGTDGSRALASFSSAGSFQSALYAPTIAAPAVALSGLRASRTDLVGPGSQRATEERGLDAAYYTIGSGTSFATPIIVSLVARMVEANPSLSPDEIKMIIQETATQMPRNDRAQVGSGFVNFAAASHKAAKPSASYGTIRKSLHRHADFNYIRSRVNRTEAATSLWNRTKKHVVEVPSGTAYLEVALGWSDVLTDLNLQLYDPSGRLVATSNQTNGPVLFARTEGVDVRQPVAGRWTATVVTASSVLGSHYSLADESYQANYRILDLVSPSSQKALEALVRARVFQSSQRLDGTESVSRIEMARAFTAWGQPLIFPDAESFMDIRDHADQLVAESVAGSATLGPNLFVGIGNRFRGSTSVSRIEFCRAIVRFAGLEALAVARSGANILAADARFLSNTDRGYVSVALEYGFISTNSSMLNPNGDLTSGDLASAFANLR